MFAVYSNDEFSKNDAISAICNACEVGYDYIFSFVILLCEETGATVTPDGVAEAFVRGVEYGCSRCVERGSHEVDDIDDIDERNSQVVMSRLLALTSLNNTQACELQREIIGNAVERTVLDVSQFVDGSCETDKRNQAAIVVKRHLTGFIETRLAQWRDHPSAFNAMIMRAHSLIRPS